MIFYEPNNRDKTLLPHDPFKALIVPRPIGWVSTMGRNGAVNLAPYSFFNAFSDSPPILGFSSSGRKDSLAFAQETGEFVWNMATWDLREAMNQSSLPIERGKSEFDVAGLETSPSRCVRPPRVALSPCAMECVVTEIIQLKTRENVSQSWLVLGEVVGVHLDPQFIEAGLVRTQKLKPIARCGYTSDYSVLDKLFPMERPTVP